MTYGIDLRRKVVSFVSDKGNKSEASRLFKVSLWCVNDWCKRSFLAAQPHLNRVSKIDMKKLSWHIRNNNDVILRELAVEFDVTEQAIWYALRRLVIHKKTMRYSERDHNKRVFYLRAGFVK
jgi:transposase